jgi:hypothetical protein
MPVQEVHHGETQEPQTEHDGTDYTELFHRCIAFHREYYPADESPSHDQATM